MARSRNIKPGFYTNEDLAECSIWARFIFPGLWMLADRDGRLEDRPRRIKGELLPFDPKDIDPLLNELEARNFILRYQNDEGRFIQILKFNQHQSPHYSEKPSRIKPPALQESRPDDAPQDSKKTPPIKRGPQPPDSLIPESRESTPAAVTETTALPFPPAGVSGESKPDPETVAHVDRLRVTAAQGSDLHAKVGELYGICVANSIRCSTTHPLLLDWAREGLTPAQLTRAITEARKANAGQLNPAYLDPIIDRIRNGTIDAKAPPAPLAASHSPQKARQAIAEGLQAKQSAVPMPDAIRALLKAPKAPEA